MRRAVLVFFIRGQTILLANKKRGFGVGKWNGIGGKQKRGETVIDAARRECQEEIGVTPKLGRPLGVIRYRNSSPVTGL